MIVLNKSILLLMLYVEFIPIMPLLQIINKWTLARGILDMIHRRFIYRRPAMFST